MAEHHSQESGSETKKKLPVEATECGMFNFLKKKDEEKPQEDVLMTEFEKPMEKKEGKHTLMEKLHRSHSNSSSSSDEEDGGGGEKKRKKSLKELKEKISCEKEGITEMCVSVKKCDEMGNAEEGTLTQPEEKKSFLERMKEKLPGHHHHHQALPDCAADNGSTETKEKKGILEKIKEKLPGSHKNTDQEEKGKEN